MKNLINKRNYSPAHQKQLKSPSERIKASMMLLLVTAFFTLCTSGNALAQPVFNINNFGDLQTFANNVNAGNIYNGWTINLNVDITTPMTIIIGDNYQSFAGNFDGMGHSIRLNINGNPGMPAGLFGIIKDGSVRNLTVSGRVMGDDRVGGIVGFLAGDNTNISNCTNQAEVTGTNDVGGIIGYIESGGGANVIFCSNQASIMGYGDNLGGIVGNNRCGRVMNCYNNGNVHGTNSSIGGVIGVNQCGDISTCDNYGYISGSAGIGGIIGSMQSGNITNCTNNDMISGIAETGGIIGNARRSTIINCTNFDDVYGQYFTGGVVGVVNDGCIVRQCENSGDIQGTRSTGGIVGEFSGDMLSECTNIGFIIADVNGDGTGGIVGNNNRIIDNCENGGAVQGGQSNTGGIAGINSGGIKNCLNVAPIFTADISNPTIGAIVGTNNGNADNCYYDIQMYKGYYIGAGSGSGTYLNGLRTTDMLGTATSVSLPSPTWTFDPALIYPRLGNTDIDYLAAAPIALQIPEDANEILTSPFNVSILYGVNWGTISVNNLVSISVGGVATFLPTANGEDTLIAGRNGIQKRVPIYIGLHTTPVVISIIRSNPTYEKTNANEVTFLVSITPPPVGYIPIFTVSPPGLVTSITNNPPGSGYFYIGVATTGLGANGSSIVSIIGVSGYSMANTNPNEFYDVRKVFWAYPTLTEPNSPADIEGTGSITFLDYDGTISDLDQAIYKQAEFLGLNDNFDLAYDPVMENNKLKFTYGELEYSTTYEVSLADSVIKDAWGNYNPEFSNSTNPIMNDSFITKPPHSVTGIYRYDPIPNPEFVNKTNLDEVCFRVEFSEYVDLYAISLSDIIVSNGEPIGVSSLNSEYTSWQVCVDVDDGDVKEGKIVQITNINIADIDFSPETNEDYNVRRTFMSISEVEIKVHYDDGYTQYTGGPGYVKIIFNEPLNTDLNTGCKVQDNQSEDYYFYNLGQVGIGELHFNYCPPISSTTSTGFSIYFNILGYNELVDEWGNTGYLLPTYWVNEETAYKQSQLTSGVSLIPLSVGDVYPMPVFDNATLDINTYQAGSLKVTLYDLTGSKITDILNINTEENTKHTVPMRLGFLPAGIYTIMISLDNNTIAKQIIISK